MKWLSLSSCFWKFSFPPLWIILFATPVAEYVKRFSSLKEHSEWAYWKPGNPEGEPEPDHSFQWDWVWDDALIIQNIFAFASRSWQHRGIDWNVSSCDKFLAAQFVQNQNVNTVKTRLAFPTIDRNAEILSGGFNDCFSCCWMYWLFVNFWLSGKFLNNRARELRFFLIQYTEAKRICVKQKHNIL